MNNKIQTYYGEYSLDHWLKLIKTGNLKMPEYQREFVWKNQQINELYDSFEQNIFIPPIIIVRKNNQNYVLDGQQRLTSIVLMYKQKLATDIKDLKETFWENWENIDDASKYKSNDENNPIKVIDDKFAQSKQLGFSFILISEKDEAKANQYLASIFHRINSKGTPLNYKQNMEALKFISPNYKHLIFPERFNKYKIGNQDFDILRYLVLLSIYDTNKNLSEFTNIAKSKLDTDEYKFGRGESIPTIYLHTLYYDYMTALNDQPISSNLFSNLNLGQDILKIIRSKTDNQIDYAFQKIEECLNKYQWNNFSNIVEADLYFFGVVYYLIIRDGYLFKSDSKSINLIINELKEANKVNKTKTKNTINNILARIEQSIKIWKPVFQVLFKYSYTRKNYSNTKRNYRSLGKRYRLFKNL